jgi:hypothetical protein
MYRIFILLKSKVYWLECRRQMFERTQYINNLALKVINYKSRSFHGNLALNPIKARTLTNCMVQNLIWEISGYSVARVKGKAIPVTGRDGP